MSVLIQGDQLRALLLGVRVARGATGLVQNDAVDLFTVSGGKVVLTSLIGVVSTAIANTASLTMQLQHTPSGGSAGDLCGATVIQNDSVGTIYSLVSGVATDLLSIQSVSTLKEADGTQVAASEVPTVTFAQLLRNPIVVPAGTISALCSNHSPGSGAIVWSLTYIPYDNGAAVKAA